MRQYLCWENERQLYALKGGVVIVSGRLGVRAHDGRTGRLLWRLNLTHKAHEASQVVVAPEAAGGLLIVILKEQFAAEDWKAKLDERAQFQLGGGGLAMAAFGSAPRSLF